MSAHPFLKMREGRKAIVKKMREHIGRIIVKLGKKSAKIEANTTCAFLGYQEKEPDAVKKLRRF